jgi:hypothetical protein
MGEKTAGDRAKDRVKTEKVRRKAKVRRRGKYER